MPPSVPVLSSWALAALLLAAPPAAAQTTYYWRGSTGASFTAAASWNTRTDGAGSARTVALPTDVLVFSGGTPVATLNTGQTLGRLRFANGTAATISSAANTTNTLTLNGDASDDDLVVESGASLTLNAAGSSGNTAGVVLSLGAGATGRVAGTIVLGSPATNAPAANSQLRSSTAGALRFGSGGGLRLLGTHSSTGFTNAPVFEDGATFEQNAAASADHSALATFERGSTFRYVAGALGGTSMNTDRTFGYFEFAGTSSRSLAGTLNLIIRDDLTLSGTAAVTLSLGARGNGNTAVGTLLGGHVRLSNPNATLAFTASGGSAPRVSFNGTAPQTLGGAGTLSVGSGTQLEVSNPAGLTLLNDLTLASQLLLTNGLLTTGASGSGLLTLTASATVAGGSSSSFVNGPLARQSAPGSPTLVFPIGRVAANGTPHYRPLTLALSNQTNAVTYTARQTEASGQPFGVSAPLDHVSTRRYYTVTPSTAPTGASFSAAITLSFGPDDFVNNATTSTLIIAKRNSGAWSSIGSTNTGAGTPSPTPLTGTLTSGGFGSFSDFVLASTAPSQLGYPGQNPLPVELARFGAVAKGAAVALSWATASEQNSACFEVQRSARGEAYTTIGKVAAAGSSTSPREYAYLDSRPLAGLAYYRLRQVDTDGSSAYSPVATVRPPVPEAAAQLYPNPSTDAVLLPPSLGPVQYRIYNPLGQLLLQGQAAAAGRLDLRTLPSGSFVVELTHATGRHTQRLVKE